MQANVKRLQHGIGNIHDITIIPTTLMYWTKASVGLLPLTGHRHSTMPPVTARKGICPVWTCFSNLTSGGGGGGGGGLENSQVKSLATIDHVDSQLNFRWSSTVELLPRYMYSFIQHHNVWPCPFLTCFFLHFLHIYEEYLYLL